MSSNRKGKGKALVAQMGMFGNMADMEDAIYGDDDDDDLEAELRALAEEDDGPTRVSPKKTSPTKGGDKAGGLNVPQSGMKKIPSGLLELDRMVAESMKDIDDDVSDTEDPDLEAELMGLENEEDETSYEPPAKTIPVAPKPATLQAPASGGSVLAVLSERLAMYENAHSNAVAAGDSSKAKRLDRGIKTLKDQTKKAKSGKPVPEDDIPPPVALGAGSKPAPPSTAPEPTPTYEPTTSVTTKHVSPPAKVTPTPKPVHTAPAPYKPPENLSKQDAEVHHKLTLRREQFKSAALEAKHRGDTSNASRYLKTYKQFENVIKAVENGQPIDLTQMPPPPPGFKAPEIKVTREAMQASASTPEEEAVPTTSVEDKQKIYSAPQSAGSLLEALEQRLTKYKEGEQKAKEEENGSKARRMGRIVKQYQDAVKMSKAGKPYAYEDLPTPPGFPPLPSHAQQQPAVTAAPKPAAATAPVSQGIAANASHQSSQKSPQPKPATKPLQRQMSTMSRAEQQAIFLQERQLQFKKAAFKAKASGDIELAKKYLRQAKGFDQMIEASHSGLPVNLSNIPKPPGAEETEMGNLEFVKEGENGKEVGDRDEMYKKLEQDLIQQIRTATTNAGHFTKLGDVSTASKFDKMCQSSRKDLDALKNAYKHGDPVPRFHYENRTFSMVQSCTDLGDNDLDICVIRGINYNLPSGYKENDLDTYVKYEFPFPKDDPQKGDSSTCKNTNCPEYDQSFKVNIERKSRVFSRILNSKSMKIDVYYKRGLFKSDKLLGSASIKLQPLENTCVLHDSYDLMDGRKAVGGKLEVKLRVRNPFVGKQVEEVKEKWLIIDKFERSLPAASTAPKSVAATSSQSESAPQYHMPDVSSMEVLKYEKQLLEQQIRKYQGKLKASEMDSFQHKVSLIDKRIEQIREQVRKSGVNGLKAYANTIEKSQNQYLQEAKAMVQQGNRDKAQIFMTKKKLVEKEVESIRSKVPRS